MKRNLKVLSLALVAVLALTALAASSASAFEKFEAPEAGTTSISGSQVEASKFETKNGSIECSTGTFRGMFNTGSSETAETSDSTATTGSEVGKQGIEYGGCKFLGFINVKVEPHHCQYKFNAKTGQVNVVAGNAECTSTGITFEAAGCKTTIKPQGPLSSVTYSNEGSGVNRKVRITPNVSGIVYTAAGCPIFNGTVPAAEGGKYTKGAVPVGGTTSTNEGMAARAATIV